MIIGVTGLPRVGKTYVTCYWVEKFIKRGYPTYSDIPLRGAFKLTYVDIIEGFAMPNDCVILIDEIQKYANSRNWQNLSEFLYFIFSQGGKSNMRLFWTSQDTSRVDKTLREVTAYFYLISRIFPDDPKTAVDKLRFIDRFITIDRYTTNFDISFRANKNVKRTLGFISKKFYAFYDSFYEVRNVQSKMTKVFEKWDI